MDAGTILVIGGTGLVGMPVARALHEAGYCVRILSRHPERARELFPSPFEVVAGDVTDPESLRHALDGCIGVHVSISGGMRPEDLERIEHHGTANVVQAAKEAKVRRITYVSGSTIFPENAWFPFAKAKLEAEGVIRRSGVPYTIFCPTWFMESLPRFVRDDRAMVLGTFRFPWHWVAADDFARMVVRAYGTPEAEGKRLFIHGPEAYTLEEALERYCRIVHPEVRVSVIPFWMVRLIAFLARRPQIKAAIPFMRYMAKVPEGGDPTEANELLGAPTTTLEAWARAQRSAS